MLNTFYRKKQGIISRRIVGETFLVPIHGKLADMQHIFALTPVAEHIWNSLDGKNSLRQISDGILEAFDVKRERADSDIQDFITQLLDANLIEKLK